MRLAWFSTHVLTNLINNSQARFSNKGLQPIRLTTPNLLTNTGSKVSRLVIQSGLYFPRSVRVTGGGLCIYVKRRPQECDVQESERAVRQISWGGEEEQIRALFVQLRGKRQEVELDCGCRECWRIFCGDRVLGCITKSLPPQSLPILGILGSINSGCNASLAWDASILQCYYERSKGRAAINHLIDPGPVALILEKVRARLSSINCWASAAEDSDHPGIWTPST